VHSGRRVGVDPADGAVQVAKNSTVGRSRRAYHRQGVLASPSTMLNVRPIRQALVHGLTALVTTLALAGCGAEVAGGAATVGALQATQAKQAQAQQAQAVDKMKAAQEAGLSRAASAGD
jgi:hypothetical protein